MKTNPLNTRKQLVSCATIGFALLLLFVSPRMAAAQWSTPDSNNNIYYNAGNVGIGTTAPGTRLNISGGQLLVDGASSYPQVKLAPSSGHAILDIVRASSSTGENGVRFMTGTTNNYEIYVPPNTSDLRFYSGGDKVTF